MAERNRGMWTCEACGREFALMHEDRYSVRDEIKSGSVASIGSMVSIRSEAEPVMWDAFDCPYCGCQNRVLIRKRTVEEIIETTDTVEDACDECPIQEVCPATWKYGDKCE